MQKDSLPKNFKNYFTLPNSKVTLSEHFLIYRKESQRKMFETDGCKKSMKKIFPEVLELDKIKTKVQCFQKDSREIPEILLEGTNF